jgi:hypothetical protein
MEEEKNNSNSNDDPFDRSVRVPVVARPHNNTSSKNQSYSNGNSNSSDFDQAHSISSLADFIEIQKLGDGSYSQVFLVRRKHDQLLYALKKVQIV